MLRGRTRTKYNWCTTGKCFAPHISTWLHVTSKPPLLRRTGLTFTEQVIVNQLACCLWCRHQPADALLFALQSVHFGDDPGAEISCDVHKKCLRRVSCTCMQHMYVCVCWFTTIFTVKAKTIEPDSGLIGYVEDGTKTVARSYANVDDC